MYRSSLFLTAALVGATIGLVQQVAVAKSELDVGDIVRAVVVEIRLQKDRGVGSGVIIDHKGNFYTLGTNRYVVCGNSCTQLPFQVPATADEYFIAEFNKYVEPSDNVVAGKQYFIQEFSTAIRLNPRYQDPYSIRAIAYDQIRKFQQSLADFNQAILINPKDSKAYNNRAWLKYSKLNDIQGALSDFNQAILINPQYSEAYSNRGFLKAYKLNDRAGAIQDLRQAARLFREQERPQDSQRAVRILQQLGATE